LYARGSLPRQTSALARVNIMDHSLLETDWLEQLLEMDTGEARYCLRCFEQKQAQASLER